jgi:rfaE bifunctional protein kinase chain/domain
VSTKLLQSFSRVRVLVVGDLVADHYVYGQTERVSREAPVLIVRHEREEVKLGGGANVAANARALGGRVTALGAIGKDTMGAALRQAFAAQGIAVRAVSDRDVATETKTRVLAGGVNTSRQQMLRIDRGVTGPLPPRLQRALARALQAALETADVAIVSDYGAGVLNDATREVLRAWAGQGGIVAVDSRFSLSAWAGFTICKPNEPELSALTGRPVRTEAELLEVGQVALDRLACQTLLVTRGRHGMALFEAGRPPRLIPVHGKQEAVDVTGAGDTVIASFALARAAGASSLEAAQVANVAGALVVQKPGTATVTRPELLRELSR